MCEGPHEGSTDLTRGLERPLDKLSQSHDLVSPVFCLYFDGAHTNFKMPTPRESDGAYESCKHVELCCADKKQQLSNSDDVTTQPFFLTASSTCKDMRIALLQSVHKYTILN